MDDTNTAVKTRTTMTREEVLESLIRELRGTSNDLLEDTWNTIMCPRIRYVEDGVFERLED